MRNKERGKNWIRCLPGLIAGDHWKKKRGKKKRKISCFHAIPPENCTTSILSMGMQERPARLACLW